jgi:hypothetical protein
VEIVGVDGGATPDPKARRGVTVAADVKGDAFLLQQRREPLGEVGLGVRRQGGDLGRHDLEADRGVGA